MGKQSKNAIPCCLRCGKPVTEICRKTGKAGVKGEYRKWHLKCAASKCMKEKRLGEVDECLRIEKERDDRLLQAWLDRQDALESLSRGEEQQVWQCRNCGYTYIGKSAPLKCPVCAHPQSYFELKKINY